MERRTPEGVLLGREHAVPAMEAIRYYTAGGAFATRTDQRRGRLAPRMLADFAVLSADPAAVPPEDFHTITVLRTIAGGRQTFG